MWHDLIETGRSEPTAGHSAIGCSHPTRRIASGSRRRIWRTRSRDGVRPAGVPTYRFTGFATASPHSSSTVARSSKPSSASDTATPRRRCAITPTRRRSRTGRRRRHRHAARRNANSTDPDDVVRASRTRLREWIAPLDDLLTLTWPDQRIIRCALSATHPAESWLRAVCRPRIAGDYRAGWSDTERRCRTYRVALSGRGAQPRWGWWCQLAVVAAAQLEGPLQLSPHRRLTSAVALIPSLLPGGQAVRSAEVDCKRQWTRHVTHGQLLGRSHPRRASGMSRSLLRTVRNMYCGMSTPPHLARHAQRRTAVAHAAARWGRLARPWRVPVTAMHASPPEPPPELAVRRGTLLVDRRERGGAGGDNCGFAVSLASTLHLHLCGILVSGGRRHHRVGRVSRVRRAVEFDDRRGHRVGSGGGEEDRPVLRFDASDLGGEEGEGPVLVVGDAGDGRPKPPASRRVARRGTPVAVVRGGYDLA